MVGNLSLAIECNLGMLGESFVLTEHIDLPQLLGHTVQEGGDLLFVGDIKRYGGELAASLNTRCLMCGSTVLRDLLESVQPARSENYIGPRLHACTTSA